MRYLKYFALIVAVGSTLWSCQNTIPTLDLPQAKEAGSIQVQTESGPDLTKLVSEEIVLAAAMPITKDAQDDLVERSSDPLPLEPVTTAVPTLQMPTDLWQVIRDGMTLDHHVDSSRVKSELNWYIRHPDYLNRVATRATRYMFSIVSEIKRRNLPMELALLPVVESAFDPFAYSHGRASGLWQFIPSTAKLYGLKIDYWYDGRRDVVAATDAALKYLAASHKSLNNDWLLALAAYNTGEGNVRHAMARNLRNNKPVDFFSLGLFRETSAYVPRLLAISALIARPDKYGITLKTIANEAYFETAEIGSQIDLSKAAALAEISTEELYLLNPAFNKWSTHPRGPHRLLVPINKAAVFRQNLSQLPASERIGWQHHLVVSGDNLGALALKYQTTIKAIQQINELKGSLIVVGDSLIMPVAAKSADHYQLSESQRLKYTQAYAKQKLGVQAQKYRVRPGDSLWRIGKKFGVSTRSLAKWNGMAPTDLLRSGKQLTIFKAKNEPTLAWAASPAQNGNNGIIRKVNYRVRRGESLSRIAHKFNLSVNKIKRWNRAIGAKKYLQPGDKITLYVDVTKTR